jgi:hypothetical protein
VAKFAKTIEFFKHITPYITTEKLRDVYANTPTGSDSLISIYSVDLTCRTLMSAARYFTRLKTQRLIRQPECDRSPLLLDHLAVLATSRLSSSSRHEHRSIASIAPHSCVISIDIASTEEGQLTARVNIENL